MVFFVLASVLLLAGSLSFLHYRALTNWIDEDFRNQAVLFSLEISATINDLNGSHKQPAIERDIREIMTVRKNVIHMEVLSFSDKTPTVVASSAPTQRIPLMQRDMKSVRNGRIVSRMGKSAAARAWTTFVPIGTKDNVIGALATRFSVAQADELSERINRWTIAVVVIAATAMTALMAIVVTFLVNRPIGKLLGAMNRYRAGGTGVTVALSGRDEFTALAKHFNDMMRQIDAFSQDMADRVNAATQQLEARYQEVRRLNEALHHMRADLSRAERMAVAGHVVAEVAHEVGTPLHSVLGHLELLRAELSGDPAQKRLDIIQGQVKRVESIIRQLLDLSRRDLGPMGRVDLAEVIRDAVDVVSPGLTGQPIDLSAVPDRGLPPVTGRRDQLMQVLLNLLANAMDATANGGHISVAARDTGCGTVEVRVKDTGPGVPRERHAEIFKPYVTTRPPGKGTGLGLFVASEIVRSHGGRIVVESDSGQGCTMRVSLPKSKGNA